jgi:hypothetical protein
VTQSWYCRSAATRRPCYQRLEVEALAPGKGR